MEFLFETLTFSGMLALTKASYTDGSVVLIKVFIFVI